MSFFDDIIDFGRNLLGGNDLGSTAVRTILGGLAVRALEDNDQREVDQTDPSSAVGQAKAAPDLGVRVQTDADPDNHIPVVYGEAYLGGKLVDVNQSTDRRTMHFCFAICERTGTTIAGQQSVISFRDVYYNNSRVVFKDDGITLDYVIDRNGSIDRSSSGLIKFYCYNNGSTNQVNVEDYATPTPTAAYDVMPAWSTSHTMNELVFVVVEARYQQDANLSSLGNIQVHISNSMNQPGDCLFDYMTNTRYGAGIPQGEIAVQ